MRSKPPHLIGAQKAGVELMLLGHLIPVGKFGERSIGLGQIQASARRKGEIALPGLLGKTAPDSIGLHHDGELRGVAPLLANPATVATRLLPRYPSFLAQEHFHTASGEKIGTRRPHDTSPDDHGIDRLGQ